MERLIGAISLTVLMGLAAVAQVRPTSEGSVAQIMGIDLETLPPAPLIADAPLSRAELAKLLVETFKLSPAPHAIAIQDLDQSHRAYPEIQAVLSLGIMGCDRQGKFHPDQPVPRAEALATLAKVQGYSSLSRQAASKMLEASKVEPFSPITQGEMARALKVYLGEPN